MLSHTQESRAEFTIAAEAASRPGGGVFYKEVVRRVVSGVWEGVL